MEHDTVQTTDVDSFSLPQTGWRRRIATRFVRLLLALFARVEIHGREHLPATGGGLVILNHLSNIDPPLVFLAVDQEKMTGLVASDYRDRRIERFFVEAGGGIWLRRGASDREALTLAIRLLEDGWLVGIAPEGTRSREKALAAGKRGSAFLAHQADATIYPVGIAGTEDWAQSLKRLRRPRIVVRFGPPFQLPPIEPGNHKQQLETCTRLMMCHIAALLPPALRGVYADDPLVQILIDQEPAMPAFHTTP
jgi:1-acyl-sn-glycerol-3-phosphate acyltransferase